MLKTLVRILGLAAVVALPAAAQITNVSIGTTANDGTGDPLRTAFIKLNTNVWWITNNFTQTNHTTGVTISNAQNNFTGNYWGNMIRATNLSTTNLVGTLQNGNFPATLPAASGANLTALNAGNISSGTLAIANGGTAATTARATGATIGVYQMSTLGGNNAFVDMSNATAAFEGQIGMSYYGGKQKFLWTSGGTSAGDWRYGWAFPAGIQEIGDQTFMDPNLSGVGANAIWNLNGSAAGYNSSGDSSLIVRNWSTNTSNSGSAIGVAIMRTNGTGTGSAVVSDMVGAQFAHVPQNRVAGLIPGNCMLVFNRDATHNKGFTICSPGGGQGSGLDGGNYSYMRADFIQHIWGIPQWVASAYQPSDSGWVYSLAIDPLSGQSTFNATNAAITVNRLTKAARNAMSATNGMFCFQTDNTPGLRAYNGTHWVKYTESNDD